VGPVELKSNFWNSRGWGVEQLFSWESYARRCV